MLTMILIEGLPGTGKSTLAKNLASYLRKDGIEVNLFLETDKTSPFRYKDGTSIESDINDFEAQIIKMWKAFLENTKNESLMIQESLTIQQQLNFPLAIDEVARGERVIFDIFKLLKEKSPKVIYLFSENPSQHFEKVMETRGTNWIKQSVSVLEKAPWCERRGLKSTEAINAFISELSFRTENILKVCPFEVKRFNIDRLSYDEILKQTYDRIK